MTQSVIISRVLSGVMVPLSSLLLSPVLSSYRCKWTASQECHVIQSINKLSSLFPRLQFQAHLLLPFSIWHVHRYTWQAVPWHSIIRCLPYGLESELGRKSGYTVKSHAVSLFCPLGYPVYDFLGKLTVYIRCASMKDYDKNSLYYILPAW